MNGRGKPHFAHCIVVINPREYIMRRYWKPNPHGRGLKPNQSKWLNSETKPIRLPEVLIPEILEYAHKLDKGNCERQHEGNLKQALSILEDCLDSKKYPANKGGAIKREIKKALSLLQ